MIRRALIGFVAMVLLMSFSFAAFAKAHKRPAATRDTLPPQKRVLNIEPELIETRLRGPNNVEIVALTNPEGKTLIILRQDFVPEITKSAEQL